MNKCYNYTEECDNANICPCFKYEEDINLIYHKKDILNNQIQTCYRYLDYIEDFLEKYDESTGGKFMDNTDYDSWIAALRGNLRQIVMESG